MTSQAGRARQHGAVACGHPLVARAVREILEDGGSAFDAALAGMAASCVAEPVLASLGGGGFLLARSEARGTELYDFFVDTPRAGSQSGRRQRDELDVRRVTADFGTATQDFHIGVGTIATPGALPGLFAIHRALCGLPLARLLEPAVRLAREGFPLAPFQAFLFQVVGPIVQATAEVRALHCQRDGNLLGAGALFRQEALADCLEALAAEGEALYRNGELGEKLCRLCRDEGGLLTQEDISGYRVMRRRPLSLRFDGAEIATNPAPSIGGALIADSLRRLDGCTLGAWGSPEHMRALAEAMIATNTARAEIIAGLIAEGEPLDDPQQEPFETASTVGQHPPATRGTTHISVADSAGNLAAVSLSNGEGCGRLLPGSGIILNNMLGEEDLVGAELDDWTAGVRLGSMMAPSLALRDDGSLIALGSGGSNRLRSAILQVLINATAFGRDLPTAVTAPRLHMEGGVCHLEQGYNEAVVSALKDIAPDAFQLWPAGNLFFGGVHAVGCTPGGELAAAGDPRRAGVAEVF